MIKIVKSTTMHTNVSTPVPSSPDDIDDRLYKDVNVKIQLRNDQHQKCAYCERCFNGDYGAVEHYRPKRKYKSANGAPENVGYYWLAYSWDNLLYSCSECNTSYKKTLFPLYDESKRDIEHKDISKEKPLIINPSIDDPSLILGWHMEFVVPISNDPYLKQKAETTIDIFALNTRADLVRRRYTTFRSFIKAKALYLTLKRNKASDSLIQIARSFLDDFTSNDVEFSGMLRNQISSVPLKISDN